MNDAISSFGFGEATFYDILRSMNHKARTRRNWIITASIFVLVVSGLLYYQSMPGDYDEFAKCLKEKGTIFYGAFWCPHCQKQKAMFGNSAKYLPYVECSTPDGRGMIASCKEKGVEGYPTWVYPDGSRESGEIRLERLAEKTGCEIHPTT